MKEFIKKHKWIIVVVAAFFATYWISSANNSSVVTTQQLQATKPQLQRQIPVSPVVDTNLSNNNSYTNVNGNTVHSPAYSENGNIPAGASARCGDGTYSFSQNRRGTCSRHGGVATWL